MDHVPGSLAQIAVGVDGDFWGLNSASSIYHYAQSGFWTQVSGQLAHIAVGSAGAVYGINSSGGAFRYNPGAGYFEYLGGPAFSQIAVGADGSLVGLSNDVEYAYRAGDWVAGPTDIAISQVAAGTGASIYGLDASGNIHFYNGQGRTLVPIQGTLSSIAVGANGAVWGINSSQEIFTLQISPLAAIQSDMVSSLATLFFSRIRKLL